MADARQLLHDELAPNVSAELLQSLLRTIGAANPESVAEKPEQWPKVEAAHVRITEDLLAVHLVCPGGLVLFERGAAGNENSQVFPMSSVRRIAFERPAAGDGPPPTESLVVEIDAGPATTDEQTRTVNDDDGQPVQVSNGRFRRSGLVLTGQDTESRQRLQRFAQVLRSRLLHPDS